MLCISANKKKWHIPYNQPTSLKKKCFFLLGIFTASISPSAQDCPGLHPFVDQASHVPGLKRWDCKSPCIHTI